MSINFTTSPDPNQAAAGKYNQNEYKTLDGIKTVGDGSRNGSILDSKLNSKRGMVPSRNSK